MPTYEYRCSICSAGTETFCLPSQKPDRVECPACASDAYPILSASTFHLGEGAWAYNRYSGDSNFRFPDDSSEKRK